MKRQHLCLALLAWFIFLPLFLVAFTETTAQSPPSRRRRTQRGTSSKSAIGLSSDSSASPTDDPAPVRSRRGTSVTERASKRRVATGLAAIALAVAALVNPISSAVISACAEVVTSGYDQVFTLRFIFLVVLLPTVILGLTADLWREIARRRRSARRGANPEPWPLLPDVS